MLCGPVSQIASACTTCVVTKITFIGETIGEVLALNMISSVTPASMGEIIANNAGEFATVGIFAHVIQKLFWVCYRTT